MARTTIEISDDVLKGLADDAIREIAADLIRHEQLHPDGSATQPWLDDGGQAWVMTAHAAEFAGRVIVWTDTDEAGVDDIEISDGDGETYDADALAWAREIAGGLGTLARRSDDQHHYTATGAQYQPAGYDRDGYAESYVPEEEEDAGDADDE